ncbi:MAG: hypothetical protein J2P25_23935, partial [Nocardiopsaceae bacterium]|nr:hypothetical protein [Nocardiopsaceae bacterium]
MDYEFLSLAIGEEGGEAGAGGHRHAGSDARAAVPGWVIGALRPIADGSSPVRAVIHPLGFTCLPVERAGRDGVCVHLWSPRLNSAVPTTSAIHAHSWHLASYVLFGRMENRLMRVAGAGASEAASGGEAGLYRVLKVRSHGDVDELVPTPGLVRCLPGQRQVIGAGDVYSMRAGEFHSTEVLPGAEAATVALGRTVPGVDDRSL